MIKFKGNINNINSGHFDEHCIKPLVNCIVEIETSFSRRHIHNNRG